MGESGTRSMTQYTNIHLCINQSLYDSNCVFNGKYCLNFHSNGMEWHGMEWHGMDVSCKLCLISCTGKCFVDSKNRTYYEYFSFCSEIIQFNISYVQSDVQKEVYCVLQFFYLFGSTSSMLFFLSLTHYKIRNTFMLNL